jgi:prepilin-type N-terminal cleavage/methylation domain-containing protein
MRHSDTNLQHGAAPRKPIHGFTAKVTPKDAGSAFTLVELLVVIAIVAILAGLLLSALNETKDRAKLTKCLDNLHQAGLAFQMYRDDSRDRFPPQGRPPNYTSFQYGGADPVRQAPQVSQAAPAAMRPLWPYARTFEMFHCPADTGGGANWFAPDDVKSLFQLTGTSYKYNNIPWWVPLERQADPVQGLAEKPSHWVDEPSRFILLNEWPALPLAPQYGGPLWTVWHFRRGPSAVNSAAEIRQKVISPVMMIDGHAAACDFTAAVKSAGPAEPAPAWIWYKPAP